MDPIVAPATRLIHQPVGILRISGSSLFPRFSPLLQFSSEMVPEPRRVYRVRVLDHAGEPVDDGIVLYFKAPASLTGEDVLELQLHGNPHSLRRVMDHAISLGARPARPGEFLYRAYLHHKISLLKAESLNRLIQAPSFQDYRRQFQDYSGTVPGPLEEIRTQWVDLLANLYVLLDHADLPDSELPLAGILQSKVDAVLFQIEQYRAAYNKSRTRWKGFSVALVGPPNSGKSSLFNRLLGSDRAIVSEIPGTTRDMLEGRISTEFGDIILFDSAGLRTTKDPIEKKGIQKSFEAVREASIVLLLHSPDSEGVSWPASAQISSKIVRVWNKCDLEDNDCPDFQFRVSARTRKGVAVLYRFLEVQARAFYGDSPLSGESDEGVVSSERQYRVLNGLSRQLKKIREMIGVVSWEIILHELETQKQVVEDSMGIVSHQMVYDRVFQGFCIGK
ncbi:MAG: tRNA uridine-5-carboxymethylaminomethyl(34) synthesis GTPase MnmE [Leptospirales bacterium]